MLLPPGTSVFLMNAHSDGREVILRVYGARASLGEFAVLDRLPRSACASAIDEVTIPSLNVMIC